MTPAERPTEARANAARLSEKFWLSFQMASSLGEQLAETELTMTQWTNNILDIYIENLKFVARADKHYTHLLSNYARTA